MKKSFNDTDPFAFEEKPFDLRGFLYKYLFRYWYLYILFVALAGTGAWLYLRYSTPVYEVKGTLLIKSNQSTTGSGASEELILQDLGLMGGDKNVSNEIQILKSRTLMEQVVQELGLNIRIFSEGRVKTTEIYKSKAPFQFLQAELDSASYGKRYFLQIVDEQNFQWGRKLDAMETHRFGDVLITESGNFIINRTEKQFSKATPYIIRFQEPESMAKSYASKLRIKTVGDWSSVLELSMQDEVPDRAADAINKLTEVYNEAAIEDKNKVSKNTLDFIDDRLELLTQELTEVETDVEAYKRRNQITTNAGAEVNLLYSELSRIDEQLTSLMIQEQVLDAVEDYISDDANLDKPIPFSSGIDNSALSSLITSYNQMLVERDRLRRSATANNPILQEAEAQVSSMRVTVLQSLRNIIREVQANISALKTQKQQAQSGITTVPRKERELLEIQRQRAIKEQLYLYLLQKREETALSMAVTVANSRVIDRAQQSSNKPVKPQPPTIYGLAFVLGLGVPAGLIVLRVLLDDTVRTEDDLKNQIDTPILGGVAIKRGEEQIIVRKGSRSAVAEMFRLLRTNLQFVDSEATGAKAILITSSMSGEGKSFITANLGMAFALSQKKVVLLGCDLRKPKLGRYLGAESGSKGITNYLIGEATLDDVLQPTDHDPNLFYISSGPIPPNPSELLINHRMDELMEALKSDFNLILIDTPPVGLVADALLLNKYISSALFVVRMGRTKKGMLKVIEEISRQEKLNRVSVVMNGLLRKKGYGYGYGYGYSYGYGYGYYEEDKNGGILNRLFKRR
ncbi:MAG: polysaccharide biosynthesis tyrosine autokinase [Bacteroidota bacterium]